MFGQVRAIVGDADMYHVDCAAEVYGEEDIAEVIDSKGAYDPYLGIGPTDSEGNVLGVVLDGEEGAEEYTCGLCLKRIGE